MKQVHSIVKNYKECQLVKHMVNIWSNVENLKSKPLSDLFLKVVLDTIGPFPKKEAKNKYIIIVIDHYSKWCVARTILDHIIAIVTKFL